MVVLKQFGADLLVCLNESFVVYNTITCEERTVHIPDPDVETVQKHHIQENENRTISSASYSKTGEYFAVSAGKQVLVYKRDLSVLKTFTLQRSASKIRFTQEDNILVADKTGDAYMCKTFENDKDNVCLLLGHLSMLLDILLTDDKFIITCDRDEKIRVSCYPNCYNIMSYCLGHTEFVTNIEVVNGYLISASGDGTIRFWNLLSGEQINIINTNDFIQNKYLINNFCKEMDEEKCEVSSLPIVDMQIFKSNIYYIAVLLHNEKNIQIYTFECVDKNIKCDFHCNVSLDSVPVCFSFTEKLYILTQEALVLYCLKDNQFVESESEHLKHFYNKYKNLLLSGNTSISVLYKRKFDNVQEYLNRKKQRLEKKSNKEIENSYLFYYIYFYY
ncbi:wd40 repeat protein 4 [Holotrichia oblita]|uniref:Wd40 repeat protein 4 n=1 Tax=Holotrichia oblita TaxID=644536 RepID=A0ACB9TX61_HOLOL|nr:wd40 repeat protein 4 [Holotrichia oblita]